MTSRKSACVALASLFLLGILSGCGSVWNALNRDQLQADVAGLFKREGIGVSHLKCQMVGETRNAFCTGKFQSEVDLNRQSAIQRFELEDLFTEGEGKASRMAAWRYERMNDTGSCGQYIEKLPVYKDERLWQARFSKRRPANLKLPSGGAFEYMHLYWYETSPHMCVEVSYSYG